MAWVPVPIRQDGDGYTLLMDLPNGAALFGSWIAILQVAARCDVRGTLLRDIGKPHDAESLSRVTRIPTKLISEALIFFSSDDVKWLEIIVLEKIPHEGATIPQDDAGIPHPSAKKERTEQKEEVAGDSFTFPVELDNQEFISAWDKYLCYRKERKLSKLKPVSVSHQLDEMAQCGSKASIEAINRTISNGWSGIFPKKDEQIKKKDAAI